VTNVSSELFICYFVGLATAVDDMSIGDEGDQSSGNEDEPNRPPPKKESPKKQAPKKQAPKITGKKVAFKDDNAGKKDGKQDDLGTKLKLQIETLEVEHQQLVHAGCIDDAEFIAKQIKELKDFAEVNRQTLNKLLSDKGDTRAGESEVDADDLSIELSDKDDDDDYDSDMDIDKANAKRKHGL